MFIQKLIDDSDIDVKSSSYGDHQMFVEAFLGADDERSVPPERNPSCNRSEGPGGDNPATRHHEPSFCHHHQSSPKRIPMEIVTKWFLSGKVQKSFFFSSKCEFDNEGGVHRC